MLARQPDNPGLAKYAQIAEVLCQQSFSTSTAAYAALTDLLVKWTDELALPRLSNYGLNESGLDHVIAHCRGSSMKTNPIVLTDEEIKLILLERL